MDGFRLQGRQSPETGEDRLRGHRAGRGEGLRVRGGEGGEALAQATGLLGFRTMSEEPSEDILYMLVGVDNVRFKRQVVPGDQLVLKAKVERRSRVIWKFSCEATVDGELCTAADLLCAASPKNGQ